jgi:hypothetical protein
MQLSPQTLDLGLLLGLEGFATGQFPLAHLGHPEGSLESGYPRIDGCVEELLLFSSVYLLLTKLDCRAAGILRRDPQAGRTAAFHAGVH